MKAVVQDRYGSTDRLAVRDVPRPDIGEHDVLVRVHAAGIDRGVWHLMTGLPYLVRLGYGFRGPKDPIHGSDFAGRVEAVGPAVTSVRPGDAVFGMCHGAFAEYARASADRVVPLPPGISDEQAAAVPTSAITALQGLRDHGEVKAGQRVLVIGAAGGVGTFAVQLGKLFGAEVSGVCSAAKADLVRSLGAEHVIDYTRDDPTAVGGPYDVILDLAGNRSLGRLRRVLAERGTLVIIGGEEGGRWLGGTERQLRALVLNRFVRHRLRAFIAQARLDDLIYLRGLLESGAMVPVVDRTFGLDEVPDAIRYLEAGHVRGKVVIAVRPSTET
jgi:NADPH:quinone reductase-like Zn-dependent oxidoreductase